MNLLRVRPEVVIQFSLSVAVGAFLGGTVSDIPWLKTVGASILGVFLLAGVVLGIAILFTPRQRATHTPDDATPKPRP
jgi:predicted MFS family arabinose efflux permease